MEDAEGLCIGDLVEVIADVPPMDRFAPQPAFLRRSRNKTAAGTPSFLQPSYLKV